MSRTLIAMTLFAFCWVAAGYGINQLLSIGTCASGGPYMVARECPDGMGGMLFVFIASFFLMFAAAGIYLTRGTPPGGPTPQNGGVVVWFWTGLFWSLAAGCFLAVWGPEAQPGPGGETGGLIVGFMGLVMGAGGLLFIGVGKRKRSPGVFDPAALRLAGAASTLAEQTSRAAAPRPAADSIDRLEALDRLRRQGTLTEAEFQTLKAKIVEEGS